MAAGDPACDHMAGWTRFGRRARYDDGKHCGLTFVRLCDVLARTQTKLKRRARSSNREK